MTNLLEYIDSQSKSRALNKLLDQFDKTVFDYYQPPEQGELVELSKNILYGKPEDDLNSIKNAFTRLSVTLKENDIYVKFGNEAPIILLDHMLSPKQPPVTGDNHSCRNLSKKLNGRYSLVPNQTPVGSKKIDV